MAVHIIGIDPGQRGGIAILTPTRTQVFPYSKEKMIEVAQKAKHKSNAHNISVQVWVEAVVDAVRPPAQLRSTFNFGYGCGFIEGVVKSLDLQFMEVTPKTWQKQFDLIGKDKQASIEKAEELYPHINLVPTKRSSNKSDGLAEALLIANYGEDHFAEGVF